MVGTRWESSSRPLFVRTVWKDGQHHVLFKKEDEVSVRTARSAIRRNLVSTGNPPSTSHSDTSTNFKVPSVKLFLAGLRNSRVKRCKTETREFVRSAIRVEVKPSDSVRFNDINKQVKFKNERKQFIFPPKSNSIEVNRFNDRSESLVTPPPFSYANYCFDQFNLSERVLIWLDLAIQNQKQFANVDLKKRVMTAGACPRATLQRNKQKTPEIPIAPLVTSQMECDQVDVKSDEDKRPKIRASTAKRQLHIFLPNLPKKSSDSGSFLSSKASSLFQKV